MGPFTLHVSQTFANLGIVTQASDGLLMPHASAAPSLAPLALSASLVAPQFSATSGGAPLASAPLALSSSYLHVPRLSPQSSAFLSFAGCSSALRIHLQVLGFLLRLQSLVRCGSLRGPQPVALRSLNVQWSDLPPFLIVFPPGFRLSTPGCMFGLRLYIAVHRLYRLFCPVRGDAVRSLMPRCHGVHVYVLHGEGCGLLLGVTTIALYVSFG